jgi:hypothetical protein
MGTVSPHPAGVRRDAPEEDRWFGLGSATPHPGPRKTHKLTWTPWPQGLTLGDNILKLFFVFGRCSAKLGPKIPLERRGSSCSAGCTKNQGAPEGPGGALRFLVTPKSDSADFDGFLKFLAVVRHVEVGSSPKEPDFDLFARVGRRGGDPTFLLDWRMMILEVWATPGAPETLPNVLRRSRRTCGRVSGAPGADSGPNPRIFDFYFGLKHS